MDDSTFTRVINTWTLTGDFHRLGMPTGPGSWSSGTASVGADKIRVVLKNESGEYRYRHHVMGDLKYAARKIAGCNNDGTTKGGWVKINGMEYNLDPIY